jgi:hypothetical protein
MRNVTGLSVDGTGAKPPSLSIPGLLLPGCKPQKVPANLTFVQSRATDERIFLTPERLY